MDLLAYTSRSIDPADPWRVEGELSRGGSVVAVSARVRGEVPAALPAGVFCPAVIVTIEGEASGGAFESWGPAGRARLEMLVRRLVELARAHALEVWVRPAVGSLVSDLPTLLDLLRRHRADPLRIFLEPTALLAESMVSTAEDFVARCAESIVPLEGVAAVLVTNVGGTPVQRGPIPRRALAGLWQAAIAHGKPVALAGSHQEEQQRWLDTA